MDCCLPTRAEFLTSKLANFRKYIEPLCETDEQRKLLESYATLDSVMPFIFQGLAMRKTGNGLGSAVDTFVGNFPSLGESEADVKVKVGRYFNMFCDVMGS